jgi:hypothetical protein
LAGMLVVSPGCSTWKAIEPPTPAAPPTSTTPSYGALPLRIRVVLRSDVAFVVHGATIGRDSLFGMREVTSEARSGLISSGSTRESCAVALKDVRSLEERKPDRAGTRALLIPIAFFVGLLVVLGTSSI